ncbi:MAG: GNAT family N-acetyltransferase [Actinobacteria bacterium]|nr:GNAT family N-acetyltransferase [Actinomycetota bacterium]
MLHALAVTMFRDLLPAPEVPRPERFSLRPYGESSFSALVALQNRTAEEASMWTDSDLRERLEDPALDPRGLFLGTDRHGPAGYCWISMDGTESEVVHFGIDQRAAGSGLSASLVARGLQWAEIQGARTAVVRLHEDDERAARIFRRLGFLITRD